MAEEKKQEDREEVKVDETVETETSEEKDTESTEALIGDTEAADTEKEESEDILKKDGNVTPGSTYAAATSIGLNTTYNATTSRTSVTHWYGTTEICTCAFIERKQQYGLDD